MSVRVAEAADLALLRELIETSRHRQVSVGDEDLATLLACRGAFLAHDDGQVWGALGVRQELRPPSLPLDAPDRAYTALIAFQAGRSPSSGMAVLMDAACEQLSGGDRLLIAYGGEPWLDRALIAGGFQLAEQVIFLELTPLRPGMRVLADPGSLVSLADASLLDLKPLAMLDGVSFKPLWHLPEKELAALMLAGRIRVARKDGQLVGYSAASLNPPTAHIARLAVHPAFQSRGIGRALLSDSLNIAMEDGCGRIVLNTQRSNVRSQQLYRSMGFRPTDQKMTVYTRRIR